MSQKPHHAFVDVKGDPLQLTLYMFDGCPFCTHVLKCASGLNFALPVRHIDQDATARAELMRIGGRTTVPCLLINGRALYESQDIAAFLQNQVRPAPQIT